MISRLASRIRWLPVRTPIRSLSKLVIPRTESAAKNEPTKRPNASWLGFAKSFPTTHSRHTHVKDLLESHKFDEISQFLQKSSQFNLEIPMATYKLVLHTLGQKTNGDNSSLAIYAYYEAMNYHKQNKRLVSPLTESEKYHSSCDLLASFHQCSSLPQLLVLNLLHDNYISYIPDERRHLETLYHSAYVNILLNTNQLELALEYIDLLDKETVEKLPLNRIFADLIATQNCDKIVDFISKEYPISNDVWLLFLSAGISNSHYELVKIVYDNFIMGGFSDSAISTEQVVTEDITGKSYVISTLTDELINQILHIFSISGDVNSTLTLIESHFLHKSFKGEKALTKDLCIKIIEAYCYLNEPVENQPTIDESDNSIQRVLDVCNGFMTKFEQDGTVLSYKDITLSMSIKFLNYRAYDENIANTFAKREHIAQLVKESEENVWDNVLLPRKLTNENIKVSKYGNVLSNTSILQKFVSKHTNYLMQNPKFSRQTITVFLNCLLNHINLYQNFSATAQVLTILQSKNPMFVSEWLDQESFDIILNTLSNSSAGKRSSLLIFEYLLVRFGKLSPRWYINLISANLRGDFNDSLQVLLYHHMKGNNGMCDIEVGELVRKELGRHVPGSEISKHDAELGILYKQIIGGPLDEMDDFWEANNLCKSCNEIDFEKENHRNERKYYNTYDERDAGYIRSIFSH